MRTLRKTTPLYKGVKLRRVHKITPLYKGIKLRVVIYTKSLLLLLCVEVLNLQSLHDLIGNTWLLHHLWKGVKLTPITEDC